jgi:hypothetical protein
MAKRKQAQRVFGFPDIHWSDRDRRALAVAEAAHRKFKPDRTVIGGDLVCCDPFSSWARKGFDKADTADYLITEIEPANAFLSRIASNTGYRGIDFIEGNHENRVERWLANSKIGKSLRSLTPRNQFSKGRKNFRYIPYFAPNEGRMPHVKLARDLIVIHGWCAPKYAAQHHMDKARDVSVIYNHTHRPDKRWAKTWSGKPIMAMSAGCLCNLSPKYAHGGSPTDWGHGFWVAYVGTRSWTVYDVMINHRYEAVLPDGTEVSA